MGQRPGTFDPDSLRPLLAGLGLRGRVYVGFSGGRDSTALLLALHAVADALPGSLEAVHVDHGVQAASAAWSEHCAKVCATLGVPLHRRGPPKALPSEGGPEAGLRTYRYGIFSALLEADDVLCTAHHRQDQAETVLLALLRASGPAGLAAMPVERPLGAGRLIRPLLDIDQDALALWLDTQGVAWIDDPSNAALNADRNYLRSEVFPRLRARWPSADRSLLTSARLQAETLSMLSRDANLALAGRCPAPGVLDLHGLDTSSPVFRTLLRRWLATEEAKELPRVQLEEFARQLATEHGSGQEELRWATHRLRHYRHHLWLDGPERFMALEPTAWQSSSALHTPGGVLQFEPMDSDHGPSEVPADLALSVRSRRPGDRLRPRPTGPSRPLKAWLSSSPLPPWLRDGVPVVAGPEHLRVIGDVVLDQDLATRLQDSGLSLRWRPENAGLAWAWSQCRANLLGVE